MLDTIYSTHPVATIIAAWLALELIAYVVISFAMAWRHLRHAFSWPMRAIRMARFF
jgi:hypothetical protein